MFCLLQIKSLEWPWVSLSVLSWPLSTHNKPVYTSAQTFLVSPSLSLALFPIVPAPTLKSLETKLHQKLFHQL